MTPQTKNSLIQDAVIVTMAVIMLAVPYRLSKTDNSVVTKPVPAAKVAGPIDTIRDVNALIHEVRPIVDQAIKDGEITIKVKLPQPPKSGEVSDTTKPEQEPSGDAPASQDQQQTCPGGVCPTNQQYQPSRGLFRRWR